MNAPDDVLAHLEALAIVPVVRLDDAADALPLAAALREGGLPVAEITYRTDAAGAAIERLAAESGLTVGAGSVVRVEQARNAIDAGARFVVSPGLDGDVVRHCQDAGVAVIPGVATPTEIMRALGLGLTVVKLFPADVLGGLRGLRALAAPFPGLRFVPTGGVGLDGLEEWLAEPRVFAVGGSFMVKPDWIRSGRFDEVRERTAAAVAVRDRVRARG